MDIPTNTRPKRGLEALEGTCTGCGAPHGFWDPKRRGHLCPDCMRTYTLADEANEQIRALLTPIVNAWWGRWRHAGLDALSLRDCLSDLTSTLASDLYEADEAVEKEPETS